MSAATGKFHQIRFHKDRFRYGGGLHPARTLHEFLGDGLEGVGGLTLLSAALSEWAPALRDATWLCKFLRMACSLAVSIL
jgi:hypothetical protein